MNVVSAHLTQQESKGINMSKPIKISVYKASLGKWVEYPSIVAAAKKLHISASAMVSYLNGHTKQTPLTAYKFKVNGVLRNPAKLPQPKKARKLDYRLIMRVNELMK
jgi:hypothetical protein